MCHLFLTFIFCVNINAIQMRVCVCVHVCMHVNAQTTHGKSEKIRRAKQSSRRNLCVCSASAMHTYTRRCIMYLSAYIHIPNNNKTRVLQKCEQKNTHKKRQNLFLCDRQTHELAHKCMHVVYIHMQVCA